MNEWAFAAEVKAWWDGEFATHPSWRLTRCEVEQRQDESLKRSDLVVWRAGTLVLSGELRLPDHARPNPWDLDNLSDAIRKATERGTHWAFTSDAQTFLLIDVQRTGPPAGRVVESYDLVPFASRRELDSATFLTRVREKWLELVGRLGPVVAGLEKPAGLAPDAVFVETLRALLAGPVSATREQLNRRRLADTAFADELVRWMVDEQGWVHLPQAWESEALRTAQLTTYVFATRIMFYEALRRSQPTLRALGLPDDCGADMARTIIREYFGDARERSGDYQTLFVWDRCSEYALISDESVRGWQRVLQHVGSFDLTNVGYDVIGRLFERLIEPHERYRWGQHYTNPDVVDLMLSFATPDGQGTVLDPAVGGGTFLVRAYERKHLLRPSASHQELLQELVGIDVSAVAANLATVNLAARKLELEDNYPRIAMRSFFQVLPGQTLMQLPAVGLGSDASTPIAIDRVATVICNPPYVRLQNLGPARRNEAAAMLRHDAEAVTRRVAVPRTLKGAANYHMYFWFHGSQFLATSGHLALITAGEWLDSDYGVLLQEWLLDHFIIECCIESMAEQWFSEARVGTVVLVARLCDDSEARDRNLARFVLLRRKLREIYGEAASQADHLAQVDALRDRILGLHEGDGEGHDLDFSVIRQSNLRQLGLAPR